MAFHRVTITLDDHDNYDNMFDNLMQLGADDIEIEEIEYAKPDNSDRKKKPKKEDN